MKSLVLGAAAASVVALTACTHAAVPSAGPTDHASGARITPVSCGEQYRTWSQGHGKGVMDALDSVTSAAKAKNGKALTTALRQAKPAVAQAANHPIPACADPRGYWAVLLMHVNAAATGKGPASSVRAALQDVQNIHHELVAEVAKAVQ